jgi:hypothetical protein
MFSTSKRADRVTGLLYRCGSVQVPMKTAAPPRELNLEVYKLVYL